MSCAQCKIVCHTYVSRWLTRSLLRSPQNSFEYGSLHFLQLFAIQPRLEGLIRRGWTRFAIGSLELVESVLQLRLTYLDYVTATRYRPDRKVVLRQCTLSYRVPQLPLSLQTNSSHSLMPLAFSKPVYSRGN